MKLREPVQNTENPEIPTPITMGCPYNECYVTATLPWFLKSLDSLDSLCFKGLPQFHVWILYILCILKGIASVSYLDVLDSLPLKGLTVV